VLSEKFIVFANAAYEHRRYNATDSFFLVTRRDNQVTGTLGLHYIPARNWRVTTQVLGFANRSNIDLNTFDRVMGEVRLRRDFDF
jgi:outer membrane protein